MSQKLNATFNSDAEVAAARVRAVLNKVAAKTFNVSVFQGVVTLELNALDALAFTVLAEQGLK